MPRYQFRCPKCGAEKEIACSVDERNYPRICECGKLLVRVISPSGLQFKGSGWTPKGNA